MGRVRQVVASSVLALVVSSAPAAAQGAGAPSVELVSPGGPGAPSLTVECPTFSWAPGQSVAAYELAVFELTGAGQPSATPLLHVALSGRASTWTPPVTSCLEANRPYGWYMREIARQGDKPGRWSPALAFRVVSTPTEAEDAGGVAAKAAEPGAGQAKPENPGSNPNQEILTRLTAIEAQLATLLNPPALTRETCLELGAELEVGVDGEAKLRAAADGEAGVWVFGNGIKANLKAAGEVKLAGGLKGAGGIKRSWCAATLGEIFSGQAAGDTAGTPAAALSDADLIAKLTALSGQLQITESRMAGVIDALPGFEVGGGGWSPLGPSSPIARLADVVALPEGLRNTLRDPAQIIANFRAQMNLCAQTDLPPAVAGLVSEFCSQASNERFSKLLDRVDGVVANIKTGVDGTRTVVNNINTAVGNIRSTVDDIFCRFFCGEK